MQALQHVGCSGIKGEFSIAGSAFRWADPQLTIRLLQLLTDRDRPRFDVDLGPAQPDSLAAAEPTQRNQVEEREQLILSNRRQERCGLRRGPDRDRRTLAGLLQARTLFFVQTTGWGRRCLGSSTQRAGFTLMRPSRIAAFSAVLRVACNLIRLVVLIGRPASW